MNKYEKLDLVGEGAYGVVLKCRRKDSGDLVAIKTFKGNEESTNVKKTISREINALRHLRHENIVSLKEAFRWKGKLHLVFEYIHKNLLELLEASPAGLDQETVRLCIWQLVKALNYCHRNGIVHRDVKPENLLVNPKTRKLKLCDFGFARQLHEATVPLTDYVATRWYRSPELLLGDPEYGLPVDMWAVGCIMGELIDGRPLFPGDNEVDQLYKIQLILGPLLPQHMEMFRQNSRYRNKFDKTAIDFLSKLLCMDPNARLTAKMALQHPYFKELESAEPIQTTMERSDGLSGNSLVQLVSRSKELWPVQSIKHYALLASEIVPLNKCAQETKGALLKDFISTPSPGQDGRSRCAFGGHQLLSGQNANF
ncbi:putative cyclin-dependent kinase-like 5 [Neospora caninum Liverpool]|uniref:Cyclin-dependent kinase 2 homolog n=1 Tax=Neospora caninum (strain Liverpool) TaxID=572307 RepID=F0VCL9_NEOCL|nr:putative cyclin-dependent kinase-like 5 [Neospora caninum Liverpool]CBZ51708.1 putative cyclin-dependent kinase-like 5 [Neospora caninum Liverpool]CEL65661.1 TPA: cyclin-dependent kinase-like 5, putative [Neospora caninum Liverpool]|eukprot:XP_003881741.1 putative cyclin-dependent kinase-like 5 [Neospora caninum Liverpool]